MRKFLKRHSKKAGLAPGTLVHIGDKNKGPMKITVFDFDNQHCTESMVASFEEIKALKDKTSMVWVNVDGLEDVATIGKLHELLGIDPLVLEDIVNTGQRPKIEKFGEYLFIVFKMIYLDQSTTQVVSEQVSLLLGANYVISFQEEPMRDVFDLLRQRLREGKGRARKSGTDYLVYSLMDAVVDHYFVVLEKLGDKIELVEGTLLKEPKPILTGQIHELKREMIFLRKQIWPLRELLLEVSHSESQLLQPANKPFFRDLYDHTIQVMDTIESFRDLLSGLQDIYLTYSSNRLNEVMKLLTVFSTIFIPLTFIVGYTFEQGLFLRHRADHHLFAGKLIGHLLDQLGLGAKHHDPQGAVRKIRIPTLCIFDQFFVHSRN